MTSNANIPTPQGPPADKIPLWPFFYCVLPIIVGLGIFLFIVQPQAPETNDQTGESNGTATEHPGIPNLGARGRPMAPPDDPQPSPEAETETEAEPEPDSPETEPEPEPERIFSDMDIEIMIGRLGHAARVGDRRGRQMAHDELQRANPAERVDALLITALESEQLPRVRVAFFEAARDDDTRLRWVSHVYRTRSGQLLGTEDLKVAGESDELLLYVRFLIQHQPFADPTPAIIQRVLGSSRPDWLLKMLIDDLHIVAETDEDRAQLRPIWEDINTFLQRGGLRGHEALSHLLDTWVLFHRPLGDAFNALRDDRMVHVLPALLALGLPSRGLLSSAEEDALARLVRDTLTSRHPTELKAAVIRTLAAEANLGARRAIIEEGIERRDQNLGDYLAAFGRIARNDADLGRLAEMAELTDVVAAQGAIEGLRVSPLAAADVHLRNILEHGSNIGVKSQALGAMLSRTRDPDRLLDQYLDTNQDAALRAVAVAHVQSTERLKQVVESDPSLRVRQAALTRLGERKDPSLRTFFIRVRDRDPSPVLRQQARQYAEELR